MDAKEFLKQVEKLDARIQNKLIEQQQWRELALGITANMEGERVQSSGAKSKMANAIDKCVDMEAEINSLVDMLVKIKKDVIQAIERIDSPIEYNIIHMRYIQFKDLQEIADHYGKEYGWATTTHGRALKHLQIILDEKVCDLV